MTHRKSSRRRGRSLTNVVFRSKLLHLLAKHKKSLDTKLKTRLQIRSFILNHDAKLSLVNDLNDEIKDRRYICYVNDIDESYARVVETPEAKSLRIAWKNNNKLLTEQHGVKSLIMHLPY